MSDKEREIRRSGKELAEMYRQGNLREGWGSDESNILDAVQRYKLYLWKLEAEHDEKARIQGRPIDDVWTATRRIDSLLFEGSEISIRSDVVDDMVAKGYLVERDRAAEESWLKKRLADFESSKRERESQKAKSIRPDSDEICEKKDRPLS